MSDIRAGRAALVFTLTALAVLLTSAPARGAQEEPLPVEEAFRYAVSVDASTITIDWDIEDGYYLYRPRMGFASASDGLRLGEPQMPKGKEKEDEFFGKTEIYRDTASVTIPYTNAAGLTASILEIRSQGCADMGLCYPPQKWDAPLTLAVANATGKAPSTILSALSDGEPSFVTGGEEFLDPEIAFQLIAEMADDYTIRTLWNIAEGYYLYKDKFAFEGESTLAQVGRPQLPKGKEKHDEFFGDTEVYYFGAEILVPISRASTGAGEIELTASFQGCAEDGICYPPMTRTLLVGLSETGSMPALALAAGPGGDSTPVSEQDKLATLISEGSLPWVMLSFFGFGLLLAFTPCVLPMVPILSSLIMGSGGTVTARKGFIMSLAYVLPMALTYTVAGVVVALAGKNVQAFFQNPYILVTFSIVFVALALAMFDVWQFQVPAALQNRLNAVSNRQSGGNLVGVGVMGVLSALIVGPCVAAPLVGVLIFIGQTGDAVRGGVTLFALSLGMGAPLLAFGASAGKLAVKAGAWMNTVKSLFGILLLGVAVWLLARILPPRVTMLLWGALAIGTGVVLGAFRHSGSGGRTLAKVAGFALLAYGAVLGASATVGGFDPLNPLRGTPWHAERHLDFEHIKTIAELDAAVADATAQGRLVMLDFYADWCVSCKEMDKYTFTQKAVHDALGDARLLQADVTANDADDQALLKRFGIFGPPTIAFFGLDGDELRGARVVGFMKPEPFAAHIRDAVTP